MTEHKFTDEKVIKALGWCIQSETCEYCEYRQKTNESDICPIKSDALDLINRQRAEVAYWQDEAANAKKEAVGAFAERLKKYYASLGGKTAAVGVEYHVDQIAREMLAREEKDGD